MIVRAMSRVVCAVAVLTAGLAASTARTVRFPNSFARAHWLIDYRFGFIKRGLPGTVLVRLSHLGLLHLNEQTIFAIAVAMFVALCAALLALSGRVLSRAGWNSGLFLALAAFFTSAYVVTAAHLMGYFDHVVALLTFAAMWCAMRRRFWAMGIVLTAAVLTHETVVLTGVPVVLLAIPRDVWKTRAGIVRALTPMAMPVAAGLSILLSEQSVAHRMELRADLVRRLSAFPWITGDMNLFVPEWITTRVLDHLRDEAHTFPWRIGNPDFLIPIVPTALALWLAAAALSGGRRWWMAVTACAILLPLLLHFVAWDTAREWTYPLFVAIACVWLSAETFERNGAVKVRRVLPVVAAVAIAINLFVHYPLLDGEYDKFAPAVRLAIYAPLLAGTFFLWRSHEAQA
jgi:hypothetical protein